MWSINSYAPELRSYTNISNVKSGVGFVFIVSKALEK